MSMLEIKNVHKSFFTYTKPRLQAGIFHRPGARKVTSELQVLRGVDLTVEKGDVVAILGPSGSGKTTLLRCLNFLETADAGQLTFDGETFDLAQASRADIARLRKKTAFVFQSYNLFRNKTALQNVTEGLIIARKMPKEQADAVGMKMLEKVGLADRADYYPRQLSGGQQQRVAIARALASDPEIIYFDEPTSALDPELTGEVLAVMRQLAEEGMTMLVVTHEMGFARNVSSKTVFMENGVVVEQAPSHEFFANPKEEGGVVRIRVNPLREKGLLCIRVVDNGVGIQLDQLRQLRGALSQPGERWEHIGIYNVAARLRLLDRNSRFVIRSHPGRGTAVVLYLPLVENEEEFEE